MLSERRLQNYPAIEFRTADEWSDFLTRSYAPARIETPDGSGDVAWTLRAANVAPLRVAFSAHGSALDIVHLGRGSGALLKLPLAGAAELTIDGRTVEVTPGRALLIDLSAPARLRVSAALRSIVIAVPEAGNSGLGSAIELGSGAGAALAGIVEALVSGLESGLWLGAPDAAAGLARTLLSVLAEIRRSAAPASAPAAMPAATPRQVHRAIEFIHAHIGEPVTIDQIAAASQGSVRSLQRAFRMFRASTPLAYLRQLRLEAVHAELSDPHGAHPVAAIAAKWGFAHFGRFSAEYRAKFGELPSTTARAASRR